MASCEKCWGDAYLRLQSNPWKTQVDCYLELLVERKDNPCSPRERAGQFWDEEKQMDKREAKE